MRRREWWMAGVLLLEVVGLASCGDHGTDPGSRLLVTLAVESASAPTVSQDDAGNPHLTCTTSLSASAVGAGSATWLDANVRFYLGKDRSSVVDSGAVDAGVVQQAWHAETIGAGETEHSTWTISAAVPFSADFVFRYQAPGSQTVKSATAPLSCMLATTDAAPPTVGSVTLSPGGGQLSSDSALTVSYAASSAAGLWLTQVHVTGPCDVRQVYAEGEQTSVAHAVQVRFPNDCRLGVPLTVTVQAMDGAAQQAQRSVQSSVVIADLTPPTIEPQFSQRVSGGTASVPSGDYFTGDTIDVNVIAMDNHKLATATWEVLPYGVKDSLVANSLGVSQWTHIVVQPGWSGSIQLAFQARDSSGLTSERLVTPPDSLRIHPTVSRPTRTVTVNGATGQLAIDSRRGVMYLLRQDDHSLAIVSLLTLQQTGSLPLGGNAADIDITPGGDSLLVAYYDQSKLGVIDLRAPTLSVAAVPFTGLDTTQHVTHVAALANGHAFLSIDGQVYVPAGWTLLDVDLATGTGRVRHDAEVNGIIGAVAMQRSLDGTVLAVNESDARCLRRYVAATDAFGPCVLPAVVDGQPAVDSTGDRVAIDDDIYDASMQLLVKRGPDLSPGGIALSTIAADGQSFFEFFSYGIVHRSADGTVIDRTPSPIGVNEPLRISPDGSTLILVDRESTLAKIALIDLR